MHVANTAELPIAEFQEFLGSILPRYGYRVNFAKQFSDSLILRTGILIRDVPGQIVLYTLHCKITLLRFT